MSKKRMGSRIAAACLALSLAVTAAQVAGAVPDTTSTAVESGQDQAVAFTDLGNSYAKDAINRLASLQLIGGQGDGLFHPQNKITRQDIAVLLSKVVGLQPESTDDAIFEDVPADSPYAPYIYGLSDLGVMNGRNNNTVGAADPLTRQELAVLLSRLMEASQVAKAVSTTEVSYSDEQDMADYAKEAIAEVTNQRWMQGASGNFNPLGNVTRAEAAVIAERVLNARFQQAEQADFTLNTASLSLMAGTSERVKVASANGEKLPFTPIYAFDRPELGSILPDGTFVAGPTPGKGNVSVTMGYKTKTIPVEIANAPQPEQQDEQKDDSTREAAATVDESQPAENEEAGEAAEQDDLVNVAPGSFTSVKTFGPPDSYFQTVEKQYPGPVGGLVTPSEEWTGFNRQFGRKVTVALSQDKPLERVALTFRQQKSSGITMPESMDVEGCGNRVYRPSGPWQRKEPGERRKPWWGRAGTPPTDHPGRRADQPPGIRFLGQGHHRRAVVFPVRGHDGHPAHRRGSHSVAAAG
jgi:hypothetical protein